MLNRSDALDRIFAALSDPTRRTVLAQLTRGPASVSDLARPLNMSLPAMSPHLKLLEQSGFVVTQKKGRVRTCAIVPQQLDAAQSWLAEQRAQWAARFDRMDAFVMTLGDDDEPQS